MLTLYQIRSDTARVIEGLKKRNYDDDALAVVDRLIQVDDHRKATQTALDKQLAQVNSLSKEIGTLFQTGRKDEAEVLRAQVLELRESNKALESEFRAAKEELEDLLLSIPNIPHPKVPLGKSDTDNEVYQDWKGSLPELHDGAEAHWDLAQRYGLIDFKSGAKISGSGFPLYRGTGAKLQRALIQFFLDEAENAGYEEIIPPLLVNEETARGTGQLPDKEGLMYYAEKDDLYLIPTAEVPITNICRDAILQMSDLPIKFTGYTPCFRREAGSYGADVKGLNRVHQFDKVEIVEIAHPDQSYSILDQMLKHVEGLLIKLELPYRILRLCGGDLGFTSALTYDFEVYAAAQQKWLEVSSVSNFETYQSNRMKLRFKNADGKTQLAHTLNGSALALPRIVAALLENNQTANGVRLPKALWPYTKFQIIEQN